MFNKGKLHRLLSFSPLSVCATTVNTLRASVMSRPNVKAVGANFGWLVADKLLRLGVALFVSAWVARYLGPERYGVLAYGLTFVAMFQAISLLGLDNLVVRDVAADAANAHLYLGTAIRLRIIGASIAYLLMIAVAIKFHHDNGQTAAIIALAGLSIFFQTSDIVDLWFQSQVQSRRTVLAKGVSYLTTAAIKVILIISGAKLFAFAGANALETGLSAIALFISYKRFQTHERWHWNAATAASMLRQAWPLLLSGLSILLYMRVSVIFLRDTAGSAEVGIYTVGTTLSEMWYFIPMALASSLAPLISKKRIESGDAYKKFIFKSFCGMWYLSITVSVLNALMSKYWIALLYGQQYERSADIFAIHAFTFIPVCIGVMQSLWLINEGRSKLALFQSIGGAAVALSLNFILTPRYGAAGAAIATVASQFVQAFLVNAVLAPDLFSLQIRSLSLVGTLKV
jgi:O-antigen/teichoic acid export membrane protein